MPKKARQSFAKSDPEDESVHIVVSEDDVYDDDHPYVKAWPEMFGDLMDLVTVHHAPEVEQATAAPGEKRAVRKT